MLDKGLEEQAISKDTNLSASNGVQAESIKNTGDVLKAAGYPPSEIVNALAQAHGVSTEKVLSVLLQTGISKLETAVSSSVQLNKAPIARTELQNPTPIRMTFFSYLIILLPLAVMILLPYLDLTQSHGIIWAAELLLLTSILLQISRYVTGRWLGFLINEHNLMSLSRFQLVVWTLLVLSAYFTAVMYRISAGVANPLDIGIDEQLWVLMGISSVSLIGSPLILSTKLNKSVADDKIDSELITNNAIGTLYVNSSFSHAQLTDMFEGEEVKNASYLDMAKVQMFFFTLIAAVSYAVLLIHMFNTTGGPSLTSLPVLSSGFIALLGISHAGYLTSKTIDKTKTN